VWPPQRRFGSGNQARQRCKEAGRQVRQLADGRTGAGPRQVAELTVDHLQQRQGYWAIVDLSGKAGHVRTVPVPDWVHSRLSEWMETAGIETS
jgi:hypothetical protein